MPENLEPIALPIDGILDLHTFRPAEIASLIPDYLAECRKQGIRHIRIIHGKGTGTLRRLVHAQLTRINYVTAFRLGDATEGSWGVTLVTIRPPDQPASG